jgi:UDP-2,3-diacylglucosamine pyrophosphatase LpxH
VFLSDCHRGDGSRVDAFARNSQIFLRALRYYFRENYTYVEVGDGDELWKNWEFCDIQQAHGPVFELMHRFHDEDRLHLIAGNHDVRSSRDRSVEKDGIVAHESMLLRHTSSGQGILVLHGHQADFKSDHLQRFSRLIVGCFWSRLQVRGLVGIMSQAGCIWKLKKIERAIAAWVQITRQIIICGHTHRPMSAVFGAPPYFNTGSCVFPGCITGLELQDGQISLVGWFAQPANRLGSPARVERRMIAPPRALHTLRG